MYLYSTQGTFCTFLSILVTYIHTCKHILWRLTVEYKWCTSKVFNNLILKVCWRSLCLWCLCSDVCFEDVRGICSAQRAANSWTSRPQVRRWQGLKNSDLARWSQWTSTTGWCFSWLHSSQSTPASAASGGKLWHCRAPSKPGTRRRWRRSAWRLCSF